MFFILAVILTVAWLCGLAVFHITAGAFHVLLVLAIIGVILHLRRARSAAAPATP